MPETKITITLNVRDKIDNTPLHLGLLWVFIVFFFSIESGWDVMSPASVYKAYLIIILLIKNIVKISLTKTE